MALNQFKPEIFSKKIEQALTNVLVAEAFCNREYEGEVKSAGDSVRILELARPTVTITTDGLPITISSYEELQSAVVTMNIMQQAWFGQVLHDVDDAQSIDGVMEKVAIGGAYKIADAMDSHILTVASGGVKDQSSAVKMEASNILTTIDYAAQLLYENNVPYNEPLELICTPRFFNIFRGKIQDLSTDNPALLEKGVAAMYHNIAIKVSNNVVTANAGAEDLCILRTKRAIAFVKQMNKVETMRNPSGFGELIRGLALYQAKLVQPKELIVINAKYA